MEMINGYRCTTCADVAYAKKNIDPAHPKDGPFREDRIDQPTQVRPHESFGEAVKFDGQLKAASNVKPDPLRPVQQTGSVLDISA